MSKDTDQADAIEQRGVDEVVARLSGKFPDIDVDRIREIVIEEHEAYDGSRVRDFVPVLVEKSSKKRLKALAVA